MTRPGKEPYCPHRLAFSPRGGARRPRPRRGGEGKEKLSPAATISRLHPSRRPGRRNLTPYQRAELALLLEPAIAEEAKERQQEAGKEKLPQKSVKAPLDTQKEVAKLAGVSHDTIAKAKVIAEEAPEDVKAGNPQLSPGVTIGTLPDRVSWNHSHHYQRAKRRRLSNLKKGGKVPEGEIFPVREKGRAAEQGSK